MAHDERENQKAAERLIPGALALTKEAMTPAQQQAARIEKDVEASALGRELMQPMPEGWDLRIRRMYSGEWEVESVGSGMLDLPMGLRHKRLSHAGPRDTLLEAHRLCREQAWAKHKKNTEAANV